MKLISLLVLLVTFSQQALAVDFLPKGSTTTQDGYLFSVAEEQKLRLLTEENDYNKALNTQITAQNTALQANAAIDQQRIDNLKLGLDSETKLAQDSANNSTLKSVLLFGGGLVLGLLSVYAASKTLYH